MNDRPPDNTHGILKPQHGRRHFSLSRRAPAADLADHLECHWIVSWELDPGEEFVHFIADFRSQIGLSPGAYARACAAAAGAEPVGARQ